MDGNRKGDGKKPQWWRRIEPEPAGPVCIPHRWTWTAYTSMNRIFHARHQICSKCHVPRPGSQDISHHSFKRGVCSKCSALGVQGTDY